MLADRLSGQEPERVYSRLAHVHQAQGRRCRRRRHGPQGARGCRRRGRELCRAGRGVYKKLIVRGRSAHRRDRHGRRRHRAVAAPGIRRGRAARRQPRGAPVSSRLRRRAAVGRAHARQRADLRLQRGLESGRSCSTILEGARGLQAVCDATRAGTGCGSCRPQVQEIVDFVCRDRSMSPRTTQRSDLGAVPGVRVRPNASGWSSSATAWRAWAASSRSSSTRRGSTSPSSATRPTSTTTGSCSRPCSPASGHLTRSRSTRLNGIGGTTSSCASAAG